jgi:hypothetical protein
MLFAHALVVRYGRAAAVAAFAACTATLAHAGAFLDRLDTVKLVGSTVPANGDVNPYGVAVIPHSVGMLKRGNVLVSNFNDAANLQGTGTTIVQVTPEGTTTLFAQIDPAALGASCPGGVGLTTALVVLRRGWVIVGSLPTTDGTSSTARAGCLIVLDANGHVAETFDGGGINGPWDMTAADREDEAVLFVTNVLNGNVTQGMPHVVDQGTVLRLTLRVPKMDAGVPTLQATTVIGSGFSETADPSALIIGPTGVGLAHDGTLYVADSVNNRIAAIPQALTRTTTAFTGVEVSHGGALNDPLGLTIAPNGDIITANGNDGNLVETTPHGSQVAVKTVETATGAGSLFGIALIRGGKGVYFVDDGDNTLKALVKDHDDMNEQDDD